MSRGQGCGLYHATLNKPRVGKKNKLVQLLTGWSRAYSFCLLKHPLLALMPEQGIFVANYKLKER